MTPFKFLPFGIPVEAEVQACEQGAAEPVVQAGRAVIEYKINAEITEQFVDVLNCVC